MWSMERACDRLFDYVDPIGILLDSCRNPEYQKGDERSTSNADISPAAIEQLLATIFPNRRLSVSFDRLGSGFFPSCELRYKISVPYGDYVILRIQRHENEKSAEEALRRRLNTYTTLHMFEEQKLETPKLGYLTLAAPYAVHWIRGGIYVFMRAGGAVIREDELKPFAQKFDDYLCNNLVSARDQLKPSCFLLSRPIIRVSIGEAFTLELANTDDIFEETGFFVDKRSIIGRSAGEKIPGKFYFVGRSEGIAQIHLRVAHKQTFAIRDFLIDVEVGGREYTCRHLR